MKLFPSVAFVLACLTNALPAVAGEVSTLEETVTTACRQRAIDSESQREVSADCNRIAITESLYSVNFHFADDDGYLYTFISEDRIDPYPIQMFEVVGVVGRDVQTSELIGEFMGDDIAVASCLWDKPKHIITCASTIPAGHNETFEVNASAIF